MTTRTLAFLKGCDFLESLERISGLAERQRKKPFSPNADKQGSAPGFCQTVGRCSRQDPRCTIEYGRLRIQRIPFHTLRNGHAS